MEEEDENYEHACMRAELLGKTPPTKIEYEKQHPAKEPTDNTDITEELESQDDSLNTMHTRMDELNTILSSTQKKINNFKNSAYGSLSGMLFRRGSTKDSAEQQLQQKTSCSSFDCENLPNTSEFNQNEPQAFNPNVKTNKSLDIDKKMTSHLDKLDSLLEKSNQAELSMSVQNKQMKKYGK